DASSSSGNIKNQEDAAVSHDQESTNFLEGDEEFPTSISPSMTEECLHILQFCHLCHIGKMPPVIFSADSSIEAKAWRS
ncbi:MAG: hypothetical protein ACK53Y_16690, partial [bacterium]